MENLDKLIGSALRAKNIIGWEPKFSEIRQIVGSVWKWHQGHPMGYK